MSEPLHLQDSRYRLIERLGGGANARVWRAVDTTTGLTVAIKVLRSDMMTLVDVQRLAQEAVILGRLKHPAIVQLYATGVASEGNPYVVMELIDGINLRQRLLRTAILPHVEIRHIVSELCGALVAAHRAGVVHRDVKPENVLLGGPGHQAVKLADFGTAKRLGREAPVLTFDNKILGTPEYMAPERAAGQPVGGAADVYAVAVMAYEMLTGRLPFEGKSAIQIVTQHLRAEPPPMRLTAPAVEHAVLWGLTKDPRRRPSAEEFSDRLCRALSHRALARDRR